MVDLRLFFVTSRPTGKGAASFAQAVQGVAVASAADSFAASLTASSSSTDDASSPANDAALPSPPLPPC